MRYDYVDGQGVDLKMRSYNLLYIRRKSAYMTRVLDGHSFGIEEGGLI